MIMRQVHTKASNVTIGFCTQSSNSESDVIFAFALIVNKPQHIMMSSLCVFQYTHLSFMVQSV